jgi:hypothetical protein
MGKLKPIELTYHQKWYLANKDRLDEKNRNWYYNNKEKRAKSIKLWQDNNKEHHSSLCKKWRIENKEYHTKQKSDWKKRNKRRGVLYTERRRSLEARAGKISLELIQRVYEDNIKKYGTLTCILCNKAIEFGQDSLEHLTPLFRGGNNDYINLSVAHRKCNSAKGKKTLQEWEEYCGKTQTH